MSLLEITDKQHQEGLEKLVDRINARERQKLELIYTGQVDNLKQTAKERASKQNVKSNGQAKWRKIAEIPYPVHRFFARMYNSEKYYEDPDFLKKYPEWATVETWEL